MKKRAQCPLFLLRLVERDADTRHQRNTRRLDQIEHVLESLRTAIVRIGNLAHVQMRRKIEQQAEVAAIV